jgi:hypothetical protein
LNRLERSECGRTDFVIGLRENLKSKRWCGVEKRGKNVEGDLKEE